MAKLPHQRTPSRAQLEAEAAKEAYEARLAELEAEAGTLNAELIQGAEKKGGATSSTLQTATGNRLQKRC